ncbi:hypothetical protein PIB30_013989 [Stylosanthes scabra]|uniref:Protein kinase domain-containing protein n=1 Tax=Stylosanthes scabra TaxID=79078 RepID=A0ABU6Y8B9_9FABA|nr:hypothetical protein [Stylosanthes scabra]
MCFLMKSHKPSFLLLKSCLKVPHSLKFHAHRIMLKMQGERNRKRLERKGKLEEEEDRDLVHRMAKLNVPYAVFQYIYYKNKIKRNRGRFYDSERHVKDLMEVEGLEEKDHEGIEVPYFDFESMQIATDNFSDANKLGRGGYGPVYKGKLQDGEVVAVKRLSSFSSQGLIEFKNEVVLIAKLQHRNLVRLRGYCIKGDEKILLYEYMPNKSLDSFIFDPEQSVHLDWQMRFDIILGVAREILYLHQDSRLRVIHRDLKTSNILLDKLMQPKISDFGLARIVRSKENEANTERVVGTYGYMSPEYALDGLFSTKSDVFSFGIVVLEIISGKRNTGFYQSSQVPISLLGYAWKQWTENKLIDIMEII